MKFAEITVGQQAEVVHTITEGDLDRFAALTGDDNPLHMDEAFAATTLFRKRVVHGMLTASFISTIIGTKLPGSGALWYELNIRFLAPVRIGETIRARAEVKHKSSSLRTITLAITVLGKEGREVIQGEAKVKMTESNSAKRRADQEKGAVIVTGGSGGIGGAISRALANDGFAVTVNYRSNRAGAEATVADITALGGRAFACQADIAVEDDLRRMLEETLERSGPLSGIVNNASPAIRNLDFHDVVWDDVALQLNIQVKGALLLSQMALPHLLAQGGGVIVNVGSTVADGVPPIKWLPYTLAKAALASLSKSMAVAFGPKKIRVNIVAPGMTQTDLIADLPEKTRMVSKMQTPLRQLASVDDIGGVVSFLFSDKAQHITGETIRVCGGLVMV